MNTLNNLKKIINSVSTKSIYGLIAVVFVVANAAISTCSFFYLYQPKAPKNI